MARPSKPFTVITTEKKSHRTKAELAVRKQAEEKLLTGFKLKEKPEVKQNEVAHQEFKRIEKLLKSIEKNDDIYGNVINRYCLLQAECRDLEERREEFYEMMSELRSTFQECTVDMPATERAPLLMEFARELARMSASMINCDKQIQAKRKMIFDIEKENMMTAAAALRNIPKKPETKSNALLEALNG